MRGVSKPFFDKAGALVKQMTPKESTAGTDALLMTGLSLIGGRRSDIGAAGIAGLKYYDSIKRLEENKLFINANKCPKLIKAVEQHAYTDKGDPMKFNGQETVDDYTDSFTYPLAFKYPIRINKPYIKVDIMPTVSPMSQKFDLYS